MDVGSAVRFSALQRAENSSIPAQAMPSNPSLRVSVLFSEPKIPQYWAADVSDYAIVPFQCSSASRKFLNMRAGARRPQRARRVSVLFSEPKIPQSVRAGSNPPHSRGFSALQRAENSSILPRTQRSTRYAPSFQCSSASRKFLNRRKQSRVWCVVQCFSALQRAENSSMARSAIVLPPPSNVSVLFSEPKIPQSRCRR